MTKEQTALDIARRMAELGERSHAVTAYTLALADARDRQPETELEAALYLFENGGNYKVAYDAFRSLYRRGFQRETLLELMTQAFYQPNIKLLKSRYEKNCRLLRKYPYCFQQDFPAFEELPLRFYPYDDQRYIPFTAETETFGEPLDLRHPVISRNFFHNLEKPVLAADVYSQYELEYLRDNVRKSEWVGRENHVYLHYTDWGTFCAYLQVLNLRPLLAEEKLVFLIGDEISQYPIDFQARFGMDYSQYPVKPIGIREIHRLIWHTQLSTHNGGDFFNEIFDNHPNLIAVESMMLYQLRKQVDRLRQFLSSGREITFHGKTGEGIWRSPSGWRISSAVCTIGRTRISSWPCIWLWRICGTWTPLPESFHLFFSNPTSTTTTALWARTTRIGRCWTPQSIRSSGTLPPSRASSISKRLHPCAVPPPPPGRVCDSCNARLTSGNRARSR